jgi:hypothetical protein
MTLAYAPHSRLTSMSKLREALEAWEQKYQPASASPRAPPCPLPMRLGQDQYRCTKCTMVWDTNELHPPCPMKGETQ